MQPFSDRLVEAVRNKGNPCVVGLDPRIELMPAFMQSGHHAPTHEMIRSVISDFHELVLDSVVDLVPAVKPQLAFFEQYGGAGMEALDETLHRPQERGVTV